MVPLEYGWGTMRLFSPCQQHLQNRKNRIGTLLALYIKILKARLYVPRKGVAAGNALQGCPVAKPCCTVWMLTDHRLCGSLRS